MLEKILSRPLIPICLLFWLCLLSAHWTSLYYLGIFTIIICIATYLNSKLNFSVKYLIWISLFLIIIFKIRMNQHTNLFHTANNGDRLKFSNQQFNIKEIELHSNNTNIIASFNYHDQELTAIIKLKNNSNYFNLIPGSIIHLNTILYKNIVTENYEDFNYTKYLDRKHVQFNGFIHEDSICQLTTKSSVISYSYLSNKYLQSSLLRSIANSEIAHLIIAILLGDKSNVSEKIKNQFVSTGTAHILAVSGMHLGILYGIIKYLIYILGVSKKKKNLNFVFITILIIWAFAFVTGLGASVVRAAIMFSLLELGINLRRMTDSANILFGTGFIMTYYNPCTLYDIGFQLSFAAVLSIILFYPILNRSYRSTSKLLNYLLEIIWVSISVQILITPISVYYFHSFPTYFLLANLMWIPISTILMLLGIGIFLTQPLISFISTFLGIITVYLTEFGLSIFNFIETLPCYNVGDLFFNEIQLICLLFSMITIFWWIKSSSNILLFSGISLCLIFTFIPMINTCLSLASNRIICYTNSNYPLFEIKLANTVYLFQNDHMIKKTYFQKTYPFSNQFDFNFDYIHPQFYQLERTSKIEKYNVAYDSIPDFIVDLLIIKNKKFNLYQLKGSLTNKIIIHPKTNYSLKNYYKSLKDSIPIELFENQNYKINL